MNVYMAAVYTNAYKPGMNRYVKLNEHEQKLVQNIPHILESYHYVEKQSFVDHMRRDGAKIFLDSGAFSAWNIGTEIDLTAYCDYVKRNTDILRVEDGDIMASVLDGIGDPQKTYLNQLKMEELGVRPLPCFHFGEDVRYLEWYVKNYKYITIGGMVGKSVPTLRTWLDRIWPYMLDGSGRPRLKVHAFGITSIAIMEEYPWYSCDSSSWIQAAAFGSIITPVREWGPLKVSDKSPSRHDWGQHVTTLTEPEQEAVFRFLEHHGFTYERLSTIYESRAAFNLWSFGVVNATINASKNGTFKQRVMELF